MEKRLYKSRENRALCGVCGGIGEYFDIDPVIVRLLVVVFTLCGGAGLIGYIIAAIIIPERDKLEGSNAYNETYGGKEASEEGGSGEYPVKKSGRSGTLTLGIIMIALAAFIVLRSFVPWIPGEAVAAVILICAGVYFITKK